MGVTGLWKLIEPCGKPVPVETLEGKVLAVDISIWLHQVVKGFQDNKGAALNNAHLLGLFHRLCKLMYYRVKPVFVFDGCVPQLKKDTIARRQQQRSKLNSEAERIQALLLQSLAKEKVVQQALGANAEFLLTSPTKKTTNRVTRKEDAIDEIFKLPELPSSSKNSSNNKDEITDESFNENSIGSEDYTTTTNSTDDSSFDELNPRHAYNSNIQAIDVKSKEFLQLPADVRHEILFDIKETRKQSSWGRLHELPSRSDDFSNFQMKRLLKRRDVQVGLEAAEQEMGGHSLTYAELTSIFSEEGILETNIVEKGTKQITSDEHTRFLLVKDLKKKLAKIKEEPIKEEEAENSKPAQDTAIKVTTKNGQDSSDFKEENKKLGNEYDADLELAIALSLEGDSTGVYDEKDYEYDSDESLKLSKAQRQQLQNTAKGPARSYMIEYAGMNKEEVVGILEKTQANADLDETDVENLIADIFEKEQKVGEPVEDTSGEQINGGSQDIRLCVTDDSDATDSDLEEVVDLQNSKVNELEELKDSDATDTDLPEVENDKHLKSKTSDVEDECVIEETPPCLEDEETKIDPSKTLNIKVDLSKPVEPDEDLFADIFEDISAKEKVEKKVTHFPKDADNLKQGEPFDSNESLRKEYSTDNNNKELKESPSSVLSEDKSSVQNKTTSKSENILSILDELKRQVENIKNITLENIKLSNAVIEISDDEPGSMVAKPKAELIEVCDSDENDKRCSTPPPPATQSPKVSSKSPNFRTPSKNQSITEFFNVDYVVKRTPDKPEDENQEAPKVRSPFFVRKTPKSGNNSATNSPSSKRRSLSKANKTLFDEETSKDGMDKLDNDFVPLEDAKPSNEQDVLNEAANILKSQKTAEELSSMAADLIKERQELENERNRQDRMGISITQRMNSDCQDLLRLFGIPFIVAPMEAEAQCAFLDIIQLTNGTITDDSDIWLFGGRTVYKNFFAQNKHVMEFRSEQIEKDFNCDRMKLIQLACLVGSDYTTGIHGIGAVTALEILASFASKDNATKFDNCAEATIQNILAALQRFRNWWQSFKSAVTPPGSSARLALQKKLKNIELHEGFPSTAVVEAYLTPKVDENKDAFSWGYPDVESLKEFARKNFGWTTTKTEEILTPVLKKLNEKRTQQSIRNYFNVKNTLSLRQIRVSKRVKSAIERMSGNVDSDDTTENPIKPKRARKQKTAGGRKKKEDPTDPTDTTAAETMPINQASASADASCSSQTVKGSVQRRTKRVNIPETKQIIPQREKDLAQMEVNKKLAVEIMKNSAKVAKKKRNK